MTTGIRTTDTTTIGHPPKKEPAMTTKTATAAGWLSTDDAAERLGVTSRTVYACIDRGELAAYRIGRVIRIKAADIDAFLDANRIQPGELAHLYPTPKDTDAEVPLPHLRGCRAPDGFACICEGLAP